MRCRLVLWLPVLLTFALGTTTAAEPARLPKGVKAVWDLDKANRDKTATRERVCLNGLWRWQPVSGAAAAPLPAAPSHVAAPVRKS